LHLTSNLTDSSSLHAPIVARTTVMGKGQFRKESAGALIQARMAHDDIHIKRDPVDAAVRAD